MAHNTEKLFDTAIASYRKQLSSRTTGDQLIKIAEKMQRWVDRFAKIKNRPWPAHQLRWTINHEGKTLLIREGLFKSAKIDIRQIRHFRKNFIVRLQNDILLIRE